MALVYKALFGGALVVLISWLARGRNFYLAGLVPLFPTFTLIAHYSVGAVRSAEELKATVLFTMASLIPYVLYLCAMYALADRVRLEAALGYSTLVWVVAAAALIVCWAKMGMAA